MVERAVSEVVSNMKQNSTINSKRSEQIDELPLMKISSVFGWLLDAFVPRAAHSIPKNHPELEDQAVLSRDALGEKLALATMSSKRPGYKFDMPPMINTVDFEKALDEGHFTANWEPNRWKRIKTLAPAAAGEGIVELMANREQADSVVAVKRLPWELLMSSPQEFDQTYPMAEERPWLDIVILRHLNTLDFPCAPKLLGVFQGEDHVHIMTAFANRGDLFSWWEIDKSEPGVARERTVRPIFSQICAAVCWLHNLGIAHRDISVENVVLADSDDNGVQVQIIDFAMASLSRTACQEVRGKRSYQAPEMHGLDEFDLFLADNFAVGIIACFMAFHSYPWEHTKPGKDPGFQFACQNGVEAFLSRKRMPCNKQPIARVFSKPFVDLLCGLLAIDPEMRYSLGEACFEENPLKIRSRKSSFSSEVDAASDASTTDSFSGFVRDTQDEVNDEAEQDGTIVQYWQSHISVWDCQWLVAQDDTCRP